MAKRKTIGENPLDAVIPQNPQTSGPPVSTSHKIAKERLTVHLPVDLIDRVKNAVYWTPGLTLAGLAEAGFREAVDEMEGQRGEAFPARNGELKGGRPIK